MVGIQLMAMSFLYLLTFYQFSENEDSIERYDQVSEASEHLSKKLSSPETGQILYLKHSSWSQIKRIPMSREVITITLNTLSIFVASGNSIQGIDCCTDA